MAEMQVFTNTSVFRNFGKEQGMSDEPPRNGLVGRRSGSKTGGLRFRGDALETVARTSKASSVRPFWITYTGACLRVLLPAAKELSVGAIIDTTRVRWNLDDAVRELSCYPNARSDCGIGRTWLRGHLVW